VLPVQCLGFEFGLCVLLVCNFVDNININNHYYSRKTSRRRKITARI